MKNTRKHAIPILATLNAMNKKHRKLYCFPSQLKIMELLVRFQGINIEIATLNRWLRDIEDNGLILRVRRIRRDKKRGMIFKSSLYEITARGYSALAAAGVQVYKQLKRLQKQGFAVGDKTLGQMRGLTSMKDILGSTLIFGAKQNKLIEEG